jgi:FkbM family methyltransferase
MASPRDASRNAGAAKVRWDHRWRCKRGRICVEPQPDCAAELRRQGYRVVEAALWREKGTLTLSQPTPETTSCTVLGPPDDATTLTWTVAAIALHDLQISGMRILVKLDLQGAEPIALEGMGSLWDRCAAVLCEVTLGVGGTKKVLDQILQERGFHEFSTINQLPLGGGRWEADKLWLRD